MIQSWRRIKASGFQFFQTQATSRCPPIAAALATRLADAEAAVAEAQLEATGIALEGGNDTALDRADIRARQARVTTLNEAIAALDQEIAVQAAKEAADADRKQRETTSRQIHKIAAEIEDSSPHIVASLKRGHTAIEAGRFCFGQIGLFELLDQLERGLPSSFAILASEMRALAAQTIEGRAPAVLPMPESRRLRRYRRLGFSHFKI